MKEARIVNWIALVWTALGLIAIIQDPTSGVWTYLYIGIILAAQVLALRALK
jgi:hypothetical protein